MSEPREPEEEGGAGDAAELPRRPPSVRDAVGPAAPRPVAPRPVRPSRSPGGSDASAEEGGEKRPTPVRAAMGVARDDGPSMDAPRRELRVGDEEAWVVRVEGRDVTGQPPDPGAPLLFLTFAPLDDPEHPTREALAVGRSLDGLSEAQLQSILERARPFSPRAESGPLFPGTRRSRGGRKR